MRSLRGEEKMKALFSRMVLAGWALVLLSGFDTSRHSIPVDEIMAGGPAKDGIPALSQPKFVTAEKAKNFMKDDDRVLGLARNGQAKAYPVKILNWHEIVNDTIGKQAVVVTFCPLCGTGMVFDAKINGQNLTFGVSGLLYQSDMLLYDRKTDSLWSQIKGEAVTGPLTGARLKLLSSTQTTWRKWKNEHPETLILSQNTGYSREYDRDPYRGYYTSSRLMFEVKNRNKAFHPKEPVIGLEIGGKFKAYPFSELAKAKQPVTDKLNGAIVKVIFDKQSQTARIRDHQGKELPSVVGFWFAWFAFHPDTEVFKARQ
jgi:hypothetical protein